MGKESERDRIRIIEYILATAEIKILSSFFPKFNIKINNILDEIRIDRQAKELKGWQRM